MQIQISWLLQKPTDLDLHCLLRQGMSCSTREGLMQGHPWRCWKVLILSPCTKTTKEVEFAVKNLPFLDKNKSPVFQNKIRCFFAFIFFPTKIIVNYKNKLLLITKTSYGTLLMSFYPITYFCGEISKIFILTLIMLNKLRCHTPF